MFFILNMGMDKCGCFMQYMFFISETIVNIEHEEYTCFKDHRCFSKNLFMSRRNEKKKHQVPITYLSLHWAMYLHLHFCTQGSSSSEQEKCIVIVMIYCYICVLLHFVRIVTFCATYCILMQLNSQRNSFYWYIFLFLLSGKGINMK